MSPGRIAKQRRRASPAPQAPEHPKFTVPPAPPTVRDPWAWATLLATAALFLASLGAPLGEPVAEDFDYLNHALFARGPGLFDGGGSTLFWRPLSYQVYYRLLGPLMLHHPAWVAIMQTALMALATLILYRALRRAMPGPWAAVAASFPALSESTRVMVTWPGVSSDILVWLFTAIVVHEVAARRMPTALLALFAALLSKEVALLAAILVPWMPGLAPSKLRERARWAAAMLAVVVIWGALNLWVRHRAGLGSPNIPGAQGVPLLDRLQWTLGNSLRALFSLPAVAVPRAPVFEALACALLVLAIGAIVVDARARARLRVALPWIVWGAAWFAIATASLVAIYPSWSPNRTVFAGMGVGVAASALAGAAGPALLAGLVALRLGAFAMGPTAPQYVRSNAVETGAFIDFEQIARLQRLMRGVRITLEQGYPRLPRGSVVVESNMPQRAIYAFGGDHALHVWYRDTTLRWSMMQSFVKHPEIPAVGAVEFETDSLRPFGLIDREALRHSARAVEFESAQKWAEARVELDAAEALQRDPRASTFRGEIVGERSLCLMALQQPDSAEREAFRALSICRENPNAHFTLAMARYKQGRLEEARLEAQQALIGATNPAGPRTLLAAIERRTQAH